MIHSLVGQSEALTLSGAFLLSCGNESLGTAMICAGVIGAILRYGSNIGLLSRQIEKSDD